MTIMKFSDSEMEVICIALINTMQNCDELNLERNTQRLEKILDRFIINLSPASRAHIKGLLQAVIDMASRLN